MKANSNRFHSKLHALQQAKKVWTCQYCRTPHSPTKPKYCSYCEKSLFFYFASVGESKRFAELALQQDYSAIKDLRIQVPFPIKVRGQKIFEYRADFTYTLDSGEEIVEDFKGATAGHETDLFKLKRKIVEATYQIKITITRQQS